MHDRPEDQGIVRMLNADIMTLGITSASDDSQVWDDAIASGCQPDCRMCTALIEICTRRGDTERALSMYQDMRAAAPGSAMAPTVHTYTAAMRAAAEGGAWESALGIWKDMEAAGCRPSGMNPPAS